MMADLSNKMENYLDHFSYKFVKSQITIIVADLMNILSKFYIFVAENTNEDAYNKFNFVDVSKYKHKIFENFGGFEGILAEHNEEEHAQEQ